MNIRTKILLLVLPLIITPLLISALVSSYSARNGISQIAVEFLRYKSDEVEKYALGQWNILRENDLSENTYFIEIAKDAVAGFAEGSIRGESELIAAFNSSGILEMSTTDFTLTTSESDRLAGLIEARIEGWVRLSLGGAERVAMASFIEPFDWYVLVSEREDRFYASVNQIMLRTVLLIVFSAALATLLLIVFSRYLSEPLRRLSSTMTTVMETNDLSLRAEVLYSDEIGKLSSSFNGMASALDEAYGQIKNFALEAALSQRRERKVRNIFQKYVPINVIDQFFSRPEAQLIGDERVLSVLFSDIIGFTGISEQLRPAEMVESLNHYFDRMVDIIIGNNGIVDKYMGDAIMSFFGAPSSTGHDAFNSVTAGLEMREALGEFNAWQQARDRPPFSIGVGINHGKVTIGNIGSDKKMDYTVIGDMVNIASRVEGLTRYYNEPLLVSGSVYKEVHNAFPCRFIDKVAVKGRREAISVFSVQRDLASGLEKAWKYYHMGLKRYYDKQFDEALKYFTAANKLSPDDPAIERFLLRCQSLIKEPPAKDWTGIVVMREK